jgi:thioredoxin 2
MSSTIVVCDNCLKKNRVPAVATGVPHCSNCHATLAWITDASEDDLVEVVDAATLPALVDLWAPWCGPCRTVSPALENLAHQFAGRLKLVKVNVDESPRVAQRFGVQGIPTLLVMRNADVIARQTGAASEAALRSWLQDALAQADQRAHAREGV